MPQHSDMLKIQPAPQWSLNLASIYLFDLSDHEKDVLDSYIHTLPLQTKDLFSSLWSLWWNRDSSIAEFHGGTVIGMIDAHHNKAVAGKFFAESRVERCERCGAWRDNEHGESRRAGSRAC